MTSTFLHSSSRLPGQHKTNQGKDIFQLPNHKPLPLKSPFLASLFLTLCTLIALLEYARHVLPVTEYAEQIPVISPSSTHARDSFPRSASVESATAAPSPVTPSVTWKRSPTTWGPKNNTAWANDSSIAIPSNRSLSENASSTSAYENGTAVLRPKILYPEPSNYAIYNPRISPAMKLSVRCSGDPGPPGQRPVYDTDYIMLIQDFWRGCYTSQIVWHSNDPNECLSHFIWGLDSPPPPWTAESPNAPNDDGWLLYAGDLVITSIAACPWPTCECIPGDSHSVDPITTSFQVEGASTITSHFPASEIMIVQIVTDSDGHAVATDSKTLFISDTLSTITTTTTRMITATGVSGGKVWMPVQTSSSSALVPIIGPTVILTTIEYISKPIGMYSGALETLFNPAGSPTASVSLKEDLLTDSCGRPTATIIGEIFMDLHSSPTATVVVMDGEDITTLKDGTFSTAENTLDTPITIDSLQTIIDSNGNPLQTIAVKPEVLTDNHGSITATIEEFIATAIITSPNLPLATNGPHTTEKLFAVPIEPTNYFLVSFLPVLIAVALSFLTQIINKNVQAMLPFFALSKEAGSLARDSLTMIPSSFRSPLHSIRLLFRFKEPVSFLCDLLGLLAGILVTISSEAIGIKLYGYCGVHSFSGCTMYFNVFDGPSRVTECLLAVMAVLIAMIGVFLNPLRSGVVVDPWSIASIASLLSKEVAELLRSIELDGQRRITTAEITERLGNRRFGFGFYLSDQGTMEYGIIVKHEDPPRNTKAATATRSKLSKVSPEQNQKNTSRIRFRNKLLLFIVDHGFGILFLALLCGLIVLVVYYNAVQLDNATNSFERFIDSQKFGVRSLFAGCGVIISFFWDDLFSYITKTQTYNHLPKSPRRSRSNPALLNPPHTTLLPALFRATLNLDAFTATIAFTAILSKITPVLLSNIPFRVTQTWRTHTICAWMMVSVLVFMVFVLVWAGFERVRWMDVPVDMGTVVGGLWCVCDDGARGRGRVRVRVWGIRGEGGRGRIRVYRCGERDGVIDGLRVLGRSGTVAEPSTRQEQEMKRSRTTRTI